MPALAVADLPEAPLAAAAHFHAHHLPLVEAALPAEGALTLIFAPAGHEHRGWRLAAVQSLARAHAPLRINAVEGSGAAAEELARWLDTAPAVTGQVIEADGAATAAVLA